MNGLAALVFMGIGLMGGIWLMAVMAAASKDDDQTELGYWRSLYGPADEHQHNRRQDKWQ